MDASATTSTTRANSNPVSVSSKKRKRSNNDDQHHHGREFRASTSTVTVAGPPLPTSEDNIFNKSVCSIEYRSCSDRNDGDDVGGSCCSSNGSSGRMNNINEFLDLEEEMGFETSTCCFNIRDKELSVEEEERVLMDADQPEFSSTSSPDFGSSEPRRKENSHPETTVVEASTRRLKQIQVSDVEIDDFFAKAEHNFHTQLMNKYNFDFLKEEPMKGRYEWVRIQP